MDSATRAVFCLAAALLAIVALVHFPGWMPTVKVAHATVYTYTANDSWLSAIVNYKGCVGCGENWPEQRDYWCGEAVAQAINAYAYKKQGIPSQNPYPTQSSFDALLNTSQAVSPWGANQAGGKYRANISGDKGTDPRAMTWGIYTATPYGYYYHNYIYPSYNGVGRAVQNFASDFGSRGLNNPIAITINGGSHIVMVSGVKADRDPSVDPSNATIYWIEVWDPWYGNQFGGAAGPHYYNNQGVSQWQSAADWVSMVKWWGIGYDTGNGYDPDPYTSPGYYYNVIPHGPLAYHWDNQYVTIEQDTIPPSTYSENIALNDVGRPVPYACGPSSICTG